MTCKEVVEKYKDGTSERELDADGVIRTSGAMMANACRDLHFFTVYVDDGQVRFRRGQVEPELAKPTAIEY
jgi:hypothetical protein